jgi:hypothetical protein
MKIVGFEKGNALHLGVVEGDSVIDLQAVDPKVPGDLGEWLRANNGDMTPLAALAAKAPASAKLPLASVTFGLPVARPPKIICLGLNYLDHVKEGPQKDNIPKFQSIFFRMLSSLVGHKHPLIRPKKSIQFDYEGELVVVIGKRARHLTLENAADCVAGETIDFRAGETIHTENSYKYSIESLNALAGGVGWTQIQAWTDPKNYFGVVAYRLGKR